jgi:hypothetical protein
MYSTLPPLRRQSVLTVLKLTVFHFNRIVPKRISLFAVGTRVELYNYFACIQKKILRYVTMRLKWKTAFNVRHQKHLASMHAMYTQIALKMIGRNINT